MTKRNNKGNAGNDVTASVEKNNELVLNEVNIEAKELRKPSLQETTIKIVIFQSGTYLKSIGKGLKEIFEAKKEDNFLTFDFTIKNGETLNYTVGKLIDLIVSDAILNKAINKKRFVSTLELNFEIHFNNEIFNGSKFMKFKPSFFNGRGNLANFAKGFSLFLGSITGLYKPFSHTSIDFVALINNDKSQLIKKDYEKLNVNRLLHMTEIDTYLNKLQK